MASKTINTILNLKDNMSSGLVKTSKKVNGMTKDMQRASKQAANFVNKTKRNFEKLGDKAIKLSVALASLATGITIKVGLDGLKELDEASAKVKSIAGASLDKKQISKGLLKTSNATGINTTELGDTQYNAISSGIETKDSLNAAVTSAKLAKAGFTDANSALKILSSTMNVYKLEGQEAMQSISDKLLVTQNLGVTSVAELADSMGSLTPIANSAGVGIDELMSSMVGLTKNGIKTDEAVTSMKGIMTSVISPTKEASEMANKLGIDFSVSALKSKGFVKFMEEIKQKTGGSTEKMAGLFGNVRALSGALVIGGNGFEDMANAMEAMQNSAGATDEAFNVMNNTLGNKIEKLKNRLKNTATQIMEGPGGKIGEVIEKILAKFDELENNGSIQAFTDKVADVFTKLYDIAKNTFNFVIKHKEAISNFAVVFASFYVAIKAVSAFKAALNGLAKGFAIVDGALKLSGVGIAVLAIGALIAIGVLLWKNWDKIKEKLKAFVEYIVNKFLSIKNKITETVSKVIDFISSVFPNLGESIKARIEAIKQIFSGLITFITGVFSGDWSKAWEGIKEIFAGIFNRLASILLAPFNLAIDIINKIIDKINGISFDMPDWLPDWLGGGKTLSIDIPKISGIDIPKFATGTQYFKGGLANINEHGGEIVDLPNGSKVIPSDKSSKMLGGVNIAKLADTIIVREEADIDKIANAFLRKLNSAAVNLA